jgi:hypothetical protein
MRRHEHTCASCKTREGNIASTVTIDGRRWPPLCERCSSRVRRESKAERIASVERSVAGLL